MTTFIVLLLASAAITSGQHDDQSADIFATDPAVIRKYQAKALTARERRLEYSRQLHLQRQQAKGSARDARLQARYQLEREQRRKAYAASRRYQATAGQRSAAIQLDTIARTGYQLQRAYAPPPSCHSRRRVTLQDLPPLR